MLAYVHRMPCREDDSVTAKDLSKVVARVCNSTNCGSFGREKGVNSFGSVNKWMSNLQFTFHRVCLMSSHSTLFGFPSATPLQCSDWKPGDLPETPIFGGAGQLFPSGTLKKKKKTKRESINVACKCMFSLCWG